MKKQHHVPTTLVFVKVSHVQMLCVSFPPCTPQFNVAMKRHRLKQKSMTAKCNYQLSALTVGVEGGLNKIYFNLDDHLNMFF